VDAVGWLWHLGREGGLHVLELWDEITMVDLVLVDFSHATSWHAGELNSLHSHLGVLGLARWTALGDWDLGEAHLATLLDGQVPQESALAGGSLVSLGNLGWVEGDPGALLGLLLQLGHEWGWDGDGSGYGSGANLWDGPGSDLKLWLGVDAGEGASDGGAVGASGGNGLLEGSAETSDLVLHEWRWDDLEVLAVGNNLLELKAWGLDDNNTVDGPEEGADDVILVSNDASDLNSLANWELNLLGVDGDNWAGARWDDLNLVQLQHDVGLQQVLGSWGNQDHEPAVGGSIMSNHEGVSVDDLL